jgi:hypothetical protein
MARASGSCCYYVASSRFVCSTTEAGSLLIIGTSQRLALSRGNKNASQTPTNRAFLQNIDTDIVQFYGAIVISYFEITFSVQTLTKVSWWLKANSLFGEQPKLEMKKLFAGLIFAALWGSGSVATKLGLKVSHPLLLINTRTLHDDFISI